MTTATTFNVGDIVRFREVVDPGDADVRFVITEWNGDRGFGRLVCNMPFPPIQLLRENEIVRAED